MCIRAPGQVERDLAVAFCRAALVEALVRPCTTARRMREAHEHGVPVVADGRVLERRREVEPAVVVETNGRGVERGTVRELHPRLQLERPRQSIGAWLPARRQLGYDLRAARLEADKALEDLVGDPKRLTIRYERRV